MMSIEAQSIESSEPIVLSKGAFGATFIKDQEPLFLRMEFLTEATSRAWDNYKQNCVWITARWSGPSCGVLTKLLDAGRLNYPDYEQMKDDTGFTVEEYETFSERVFALEEATRDKITGILERTATGILGMNEAFSPNYIVYITRNRNFSILKADKFMKKNQLNLKNYINAYLDILISVGANLSIENGFENRGISRNPYWVVEGKYSGLSMILHGFTGAVAERFFFKKEVMYVTPIGSMQVIITKHLLPNEGYIVLENEKKKDLVRLKASINDCDETGVNVIKISALMRIYMQAVGGV